MHLHFMNKQLLILSFLLTTSYFLSAQNGITSDELFKEARHAAFEDKNYDKAKQLSYEALEISPSYSDIDIFLGRVYAWNSEYDSARYHFTKVLNSHPDNEDASIAFADLEYWNDHYEASLDICNKALTVYPSSQELLLRKAKNLNALKNFHDASLITAQLLKENRNNTAALALATRLKDAVAINKISMDYDYTTFDQQYNRPWNLASLSYSRYTKIGPVIARLNYENRFGTNGVQGEVDAYPRISQTFYSYANVGYSGNVGVFPQFRAGFSLYANLPNSFEAEAGMRYLYFAEPTYIYTAAIGKYYKNFLFNLRTYITPSDGSVWQSYNLSGRYYLGGADDFIGLAIGTGISPDDNTQNIQFSNKQNKLSSKRISAAFSHTFLKWNILTVSGGLINEEYLPSVNGNQIDISLGVSHRF